MVTDILAEVEELPVHIGNSSTQCLALRHDVTDEGQWQIVVQEAVAAFGRT